MKIQLIRNATMKIAYAGRTILTDPMLSPKDAIRSFAGIAKNPTVELPFQIKDIVNDVESVVVTHFHPDHFDKTASEALPKTIPVFCQPGDEVQLAEGGFQTVIPIETAYTWEGITITRTEGRHGSGKVLELMGNVSGFVFQADGEPTVYWVGDSIWCDLVENTIKSFKPDIIITHSGGAKLPDFDTIIMDAEQTLATLNASPEAIVVAIHMEALDHCGVSRDALRQLADKEGISPSRLFIPEDGESIAF
ncbi:MAG: MBL fold metallo-hydrolase [Deltaproteobacteria bacterium]|nr:MBL fold metallo-hydrolase [Deltaproteobacteria bacterium]MBW1817133.1 MBL fold metallo-hydrolase [Deltaproteobacteria bacterium]